MNHTLPNSLLITNHSDTNVIIVCRRPPNINEEIRPYIHPISLVELMHLIFHFHLIYLITVSQRVRRDLDRPRHHQHIEFIRITNRIFNKNQQELYRLKISHEISPNRNCRRFSDDLELFNKVKQS